MITRKTRNLIWLVITIIIVLIISLGIFGFLYIKTDIFKSNNTLFAKYISNGIEQTVEVVNVNQENDYENIKKTNNYDSNTSITGYYTENYNTSSEKSTDLINNLGITIDEKNSVDEDRNYQKIKLTNASQDTAQIELYRQEQKYGIRFSDLFTQFLSIENSNLTQLAEKLGIDSTNIPDSISTDINYNDIFKFTNEELLTLKTNYIDNVFSNISKNKFVKQANTVITVDSKSVTTNAYILTLTQEEINNLYIDILQKIENDEIILSKVADIDNKVYEEYPNAQYENYFKNMFIENINTKIQDIQNNNIGQNQIKISIYESNGKTIRIKEENDTKNTIIDFNKTDTINEIDIKTTLLENQNKSMEFKISKTTSDVDYKFTIQYLDTMEDKEKDFEFSRTITNANTTFITTNTKMSYFDGINKIGINIDKTLNISDTIDFTNANTENNIVLNDLDVDTLGNLMSQVQNTMANYDSEALNKLKQDFESSALNYNKTNIDISSDNQMSSIDINRFNSKFEFYAGENVDYATAKELLTVVSRNLDNIEVINSNQIKLNIKEGIENSETVNNILNILKTNQTFSIKIEYDTNNLINNIILTIL